MTRAPHQTSQEGSHVGHGAHVDPVCGMTVDPARAAGSVEHAGRTYYFCSRHCVQKFQAEPEKYLAPKPAPALVQIGGIAPPASEHPCPACGTDVATAAAGTKTEYVCPMDPEVVSDRPGA